MRLRVEKGCSGLWEARHWGGERGLEKGRERKAALHATSFASSWEGTTPYLELGSFIFESQTFLEGSKQVGSGVGAEVPALSPWLLRAVLDFALDFTVGALVHKSYFNAELRHSLLHRGSREGGCSTDKDHLHFTARESRAQQGPLTKPKVGSSLSWAV